MALAVTGAVRPALVVITDLVVSHGQVGIEAGEDGGVRFKSRPETLEPATSTKYSS